MKLNFIALQTNDVKTLQNGGLDAYDPRPELSISDGSGNPCRHCLDEIPAGEQMLILAFRPFKTIQPYAETGPIFLCKKECQRYSQHSGLPKLYQPRTMLIRGYDKDERIVYGSGKIVAMENLEREASTMFLNFKIKSIHVRSA